MSTPIQTGWLTTENGDKFAPKTLTSQVQTSDGILLEDKIQSDLDEVISNVQTQLNAITPVLTAITTSEIDAICVIPLDAGLYQNGVMTVDWDTLVANGVFTGDSSLLEQGNGAVEALVGDLIMPDYGIDLNYGIFQNCTGLNSVVLSKSITTITPFAFAYCSALNSVVIQEGVRTIATQAFFGCTNLRSIELPNTITRLNDMALYNSYIDTINYAGTMAQWDSVFIGEQSLNKNMTINCLDGTITISL